ncbi:MAG: hypothetical protein EBS54_04245 [Betaproteobacteria bacterium]|nr:hypothetical protein [Betaproteobacteria bacterium]
MSTAFISHPTCLRHDQGRGHPESAARLHAIEDQLLASGVLDHLQRHTAPAATREQLLRVHSEAQLRWIERIFHDDPRVLLCSSFQHPFYPFSGADTGNAHIVPTPLAAYSGNEAMRDAVETVWLPALRAFQPQILFISAGFDAHRDDDMAMLGWTDADYAWITTQLKAAADKLCGGRIVSALEGGYALDALGRSATAHVRVLAGI